MAATDFHVNGPALAHFGPPNQTNMLGISEENVTVTHELGREMIYSDYFGPHIPAEIQHTGAIARINMSLVQWDANQLELVRGGMRGRLGGVVSSADIGALLISSGQYYELLIQSSVRTGGILESPYRFNIVIPIDPMPVTLGTRAGRTQVSFLALPHNGYLYVRA